MKEQFEYGELIEARTSENDSWRQRRYVATVTTKNGKKRHLAIMLDRFQDLANDTNGMVVRPYSQIRKIQKPEPEPLFISTQGVFTAEQAVMQLQERIEKILEELNALKTQIK
jgi:hypothetical protein